MHCLGRASSAKAGKDTLDLPELSEEPEMYTINTQLKMGCTAYTQRGYHKPVENYPTGCTVKVYMYLLGCKEVNKVLPKHIRIKKICVN